jgi:hypothetical protein
MDLGEYNSNHGGSCCVYEEDASPSESSDGGVFVSMLFLLVFAFGFGCI